MSEEGKAMRLVLLNIPSMAGAGQVRKFVASVLQLPVEAVVCRKAPKWTHAIVSLRATGNQSNIPDLSRARDKLLGVEWRKRKLDAKIEHVNVDAVVQESRPNPSQTKSLHDQVTPLWQMPYEEQLKRKHQKLSQLLQERLHPDGDFVMEAIKPSPTIHGYRNKCEFTIAYDSNGKQAVGFLLGTYKEGIVTVENARECLHVPEALKGLADHLQTHVCESTLLPYDRRSKKGFWRLLLARVHDDTIMAAIQVNSEGLSEECKMTALDNLAKHMAAFECSVNGLCYRVGSFLMQDSQAVHHGIDGKAPFRLLFGQPTVTQTLCNLRFQISPLSFFQVNPTATEVLYATIKEYAMDLHSSHSVLLDLCCGTGTIGLCLAKDFARVIGVELVQEAIDDAQINAKLNQISNVEFVCDRVEDAIDRIIQTIPLEQSITVVLDPPRSGARIRIDYPKVIKAIRRSARISRVVYVSCNPEAAMTNLVDLTRPPSKSLIGEPFKLRRAVAVDLFPMTEHCELVLQFIREPPAIA